MAQQNYACRLCGQSFSSKDERDRHNRQAHPEMQTGAGDHPSGFNMNTNQPKTQGGMGGTSNDRATGQNYEYVRGSTNQAKPATNEPASRSPAPATNKNTNAADESDEDEEEMGHDAESSTTTGSRTNTNRLGDDEEDVDEEK